MEMQVSPGDASFLAPGTIIADRYKILRTVGRGGMANVYKAEDLELENAIVALKILNQEFSENKDYVVRFLREVELMHLVNHPNVVRTYQGGTYRGMLYFSLEYVPGSSLEVLIRRKKFDLSQTPQLIEQICHGLKAIHEQHIVHRDLKPGNILVLKDGTIKITDFGVARPKDSQLTRRNQKVGSVLYMAPEVWAGKTLTPAVDFYAMGVLLYELWTESLPFNGKNPGELLGRHLKERVKPPRELNPEIPAWIDRLILALLEKSPSQRPKSSDEVLAYLNLTAGGEIDVPPLTAKTFPSKDSKKRKRKRRKKKKKSYHSREHRQTNYALGVGTGIAIAILIILRLVFV
jgi:serine/threonine-protein kinase